MLPNPEDYPDFDPILLKCIGYLGMGGKEARRGLKELYNELVNNDQHRASPLHHQKSDKRKGALLEKDPSKKARLEPDEIVFEAPNSEEKGVESLGEACSVCNSAVSTSKNQFLDCNECHNWFHQTCHKPPVPDKVLNDIANDTRFVWKCSDCSNLLLKMKEPKKKENAFKVKEPNAQPFNRANSKITNIVKETSRSRESSPSLGGGWAALGAKSDKPKKEKKLQQFDLFAPSDQADAVSKKKKEVNPNAIKALKEKERKKREGSQEEKPKKLKSREQKEDDVNKKIQSMKKKGAEKMKLKAAAKRV